MEFCPECRAILFPDKDGILRCKTCGYSSEPTEDVDYSVKIEKIDAKETVTNLGEDNVPKGTGVTETCPECGHDKATYILLQTRSADEAPTRIFTCTKCNHKWRAYD